MSTDVFSQKRIHVCGVCKAFTGCPIDAETKHVNDIHEEHKHPGHPQSVYNTDGKPHFAQLKLGDRFEDHFDELCLDHNGSKNRDAVDRMGYDEGFTGVGNIVALHPLNEDDSREAYSKAEKRPGTDEAEDLVNRTIRQTVVMLTRSTCPDNEPRQGLFPGGMISLLWVNGTWTRETAVDKDGVWWHTYEGLVPAGNEGEAPYKIGVHFCDTSHSRALRFYNTYNDYLPAIPPDQVQKRNETSVVKATVALLNFSGSFRPLPSTDPREGFTRCSWVRGVWARSTFVKKNGVWWYTDEDHGAPSPTPEGAEPPATLPTP